ncbi:MAG TPA: protein translocase subunit SecD, partial [Nitrospiria bacterium]|nr:protein translocase subunit SecD [Nitrospiria bacterium]
MKKGIRGRIFLIFVTVAVSAVFFLPSTDYFKSLPGWWPKIFPSKGINKGLDLQGGMHLVLEVQENRAVEINLEQMVTGLQDAASEKKLEGVMVRKTGDQELTVEFPKKEERDPLNKIVADKFPSLRVRDGSKDTNLVLALRDEEIKAIKENAIVQSMEIIRNRIDSIGVAEPVIQRQGKNQILVQLPGLKNPAAAMEMIKTTAVLEFKLLDEESPLWREFPQELAPGQEVKAKFMQDFGPKVPAGDEILFERQT